MFFFFSFPGLSDPEMRAFVRKNILQPNKHTESASEDITERIVPIFLGAAVMALIILLLVLVLGVMCYSRNGRRWVNYFAIHSFSYFIKLQDKM